MALDVALHYESVTAVHADVENEYRRYPIVRICVSSVHVQGSPMSVVVRPCEAERIHCGSNGRFLASYHLFVANTFEIMYLACEHFCMDKSDFQVSLIFGLVVCLANQAGYHRDPSNYPAMSIFKGEMRRRTWAHIVHLDLHFASICGLPRLVDDLQTDMLTTSRRIC